MPALANALGLPFQRSFVGPLYPDVATYAAAITTNGGSILSTDLFALNSWVWRGVAAGWYAKLKEVWPNMGNQLAAAKTKLKWGAGGVSNLDVSRLVSSDYSRSYGLGPTTYDANKFVLTGFIPSLDGLSLSNISAGIGRLDATRLAQNLSVWMGDTPASGDNNLVIGSANNNNSTSPRSDLGTQGYSYYMGAAWPRVDVMNWGSSKQDVWNNSSQGYYATNSLSGAIDTEVNMGRHRRSGVYRVEPFKTGMVWFGSTLSDAEAQDVGIATYELEMAAGRALFTGTPMYFIGDSNGSGQGAYTYAQAWAAIVAANKGRRPVNLSVPGQFLTADSSGRKSAYSQRSRLLDYTPGTVVVNLGTNDAQYDGVTNGNAAIIADFKAKTIEMVNLWQAHGHTVLLCSLIYSTNTNINATKQAAYALATSEAAAATGAAFCDLNTLMTNSTSPLPSAMMQDATHLNPTGHAFVAAAVTAIG